MALVTMDDIGRLKVQALAARLKDATFTTIRAIATPLLDANTRAIAAQADLLVTTVDNDSARLSVAILATLYHRLLLDVGTGIRASAWSAGDIGAREMGADVRLILPGDGCLLCQGHVRDYAAALRGLGQLGMISPQDWRTERAGSLASLNHLAVAASIRLLEDLPPGRVRSSHWLRLNFTTTGELTVSYPPIWLDHSARAPAWALLPWIHSPFHALSHSNCHIFLQSRYIHYVRHC